MFIIDFLINCITCYYIKEEEKLEVNQWKILKKYFKSYMIIDLLAILPSSWVLNVMYINFRKSQGYNKLFRIIKFISQNQEDIYTEDPTQRQKGWKIKVEHKRLFKFMFYYFYYVHLISCLWFFVSKIHDHKVPKPQTWLDANGYPQEDSFSNYIVTIYFVVNTMATIGYGDFIPISNTEIFVGIFTMVFGLLFYAMTIGILHSIFQNLDIRENSVQKKYVFIDEFCREMHLTKPLKNKIRKKIEYNSLKNPYVWAKENSLFDEFSVDLRYEISTAICNKMIEKIKFFSENTNKFFIVTIVPFLKYLSVDYKDIIYYKDQSPAAIYFLFSGRINYQLKEYEFTRLQQMKTQYVTFKTMITGSYFGEIDIIKRRKRLFFTSAGEDSEMYYISRNEFVSVIEKNFPAVYASMIKAANKKEKRNIQAMEQVQQFIKEKISTGFTKKLKKLLTKNNKRKLKDELDNKKALINRLQSLGGRNKGKHNHKALKSKSSYGLKVVPNTPKVKNKQLKQIVSKSKEVSQLKKKIDQIKKQSISYEDMKQLQDYNQNRQMSIVEKVKREIAFNQHIKQQQSSKKEGKIKFKRSQSINIVENGRSEKIQKKFHGEHFKPNKNHGIEQPISIIASKKEERQKFKIYQQKFSKRIETDITKISKKKLQLNKSTSILVKSESTKKRNLPTILEEEIPVQKRKKVQFNIEQKPSEKLPPKFVKKEEKDFEDFEKQLLDLENILRN